MKLLFDENLSPRLVERLTDLYSDCAHVREAGLERVPDEAVWNGRAGDFPALKLA